MFMAKDMRQLAEQKQKEQIDMWWRKFRNRLLDAIKTHAFAGEFELVITQPSNLNELRFISNPKYRDKVIKELQSMGYEVIYFEGSYQCDADDKNLTIKW